MHRRWAGIGSEPVLDVGRPLVLELFYTGLLVLVFLFITWFAIYVVYKLYEGQR